MDRVHAIRQWLRSTAAHFGRPITPDLEELIDALAHDPNIWAARHSRAARRAIIRRLCAGILILSNYTPRDPSGSRRQPAPLGPREAGDVLSDLRYIMEFGLGVNTWSGVDFIDAHPHLCRLIMIGDGERLAARLIRLYRANLPLVSLASWM